MLFHTAYVAVHPNSSQNAPSVAIVRIRRTADTFHSVCSGHFFAEAEALTVGMVFSRASGQGKRGDSFGSLECHPVRIPSSSRDHASGSFRRPAARRRSAFSAPPRTSLKAAAKNAAQTSSGPTPRKHSLALGSRTHSLASLSVTRAGYGKFNETEITTMYQNKAILMGFLGSDAEVRTGKNDQNFTTFSIATKTSYKNKETGEYVSHTEWHRCIVFGKFSEFAATLKKGAHIQVEGEIRHLEYTPKKAKKPVRTDSVRVTSILKLDRAEKATPEELETEPVATDEDIPF
jgi:single-strand DNA-binding protein